MSLSLKIADTNSVFPYLKNTNGKEPIHWILNFTIGIMNGKVQEQLKEIITL